VVFIISAYKSSAKQGMMIYACNPTLRRPKREDFEASLDYIARPCLKKEQNKTNQIIAMNLKSLEYLFNRHV
jgi:hypothetical protein